MIILAFSLVAPAAADDFYMLVRNPRDAVAADPKGGEFIASVLAAVGAADGIVARNSAIKVRAGFAEAGVAAKVTAEKLSFSTPRICTANVYAAPADDSLLMALVSGNQNVQVDVPSGRFWGLTVRIEKVNGYVLDVDAVRGWVGDWSGTTWSRLFDGFRERGVEIVLCPT